MEYTKAPAHADMARTGRARHNSKFSTDGYVHTTGIAAAEINVVNKLMDVASFTTSVGQ